jgi:hypothetical protein
MFCPGCGLSEERTVQFCRSCGTDLGVVRDTLAQPDATGNSIALAREEIARALAARIQTGEWWHLGAMIPEVEKLFESPQERRLRQRRAEEGARLRRTRAGVITAASGLGEILLCLFLAVMKPDFLLLAGAGAVTFIVGLGIVINGLLFTVKKQAFVPTEEEKHTGPSLLGSVPGPKIDASMRPTFLSSSVTDQTTRHLSSELRKPSRGDKA